jgi:hypothetical protein
LHGAGYPDRYAAGLDPATHGIYSDDYISTEVLTGRPAMVADLFGRDVVRKYWLLHDAMRALALRKMDTVEFAGGDLHRQQVRWENGGEIAVNRGAKEWQAGEHALPQYGYYARVPVEGGAAESAIELRNGKTIEWARAPASVYVNGRGAQATVAGVTTDGAVRVAQERGAVVITPLPASGKLSVTLGLGALPWKMDALSRVEAINESGKVVRSRRLEKKGGEVTLVWEPEVFAYRLRANQ